MRFVDFKKAFESISDDNLWVTYIVTMMDMGYPILCTIELLAKLYRKQLAKVKVVAHWLGTEEVSVRWPGAEEVPVRAGTE